MAVRVCDHADECMQRGREWKNRIGKKERKSFKREMPEFGESIWFFKPGSASQDKLDERWGDGVYLGMIEESSELYIGKKKGIIKARTFARGGEADRWRKKDIEEVVGAPWEALPRRGMGEVRSKVYIAGAGSGEYIIPETQMQQAVPTRMRSDIEDLDKYGYTLGCTRCQANNRGEAGVNHNEDCRSKNEEKMRVGAPERYARTPGRLAEGTLKEDEGRVKHIRSKKKLEQKADRKEQRRKDISKKAE